MSLKISQLNDAEILIEFITETIVLCLSLGFPICRLSTFFSKI